MADVRSNASAAHPLAGVRVDGLAFERVAFAATVLVAAATFWLSPRLPMTDLAQHAGQVTAWRDLLLGTSKWEPLLTVNYFTPYLLGYGLALLASFVLPISAAIKLVLALGYCGFVAACVALRRHLGGEPRLDWLTIPAFFGFAWAWGFYTFLIAAPFGVLLVLVALRYAERPTLARGVVLFACDLLLFFSHGLVFLFANLIGSAFLLVKCRTLDRLWRAALPYVAVGLWCVVYALVRLRFETSAVGDPMTIHWAWDLTRLNFLLFALSWSVGANGTDAWFTLLLALLLVSPLVLRARLNRRDAAAFVPLGITVVVWLAVPDGWLNSWSLYQRFALFLLPFYALIFLPSDKAAEHASLGLARRLWLPLLCWIYLGMHAQRLLAFAHEGTPFEEVLAAAEPGERALGLVFTAGSETGHRDAYWHFPLWYQAEKGGFVDYNGAGWVGPVVRFRPDRVPGAFVAGSYFLFRSAEKFDWNRHEMAMYRYFFVRRDGPLPQGFFPSGQCAPVLRKSAGDWSLFENVNCYTPAVVRVRPS